MVSVGVQYHVYLPITSTRKGSHRSHPALEESQGSPRFHPALEEPRGSPGSHQHWKNLRVPLDLTTTGRTSGFPSNIRVLTREPSLGLGCATTHEHQQEHHRDIYKHVAMLYSCMGNIFSHEKFLAPPPSTHPPEIVINPPKTAYGCPCGRVKIYIYKCSYTQSCHIHSLGAVWESGWPS